MECIHDERTMLLSTTWNVMMELTRAAVFNRRPILDENFEVDWSELMDVSVEQSVLSWVWDSICSLPKEKQPSRADRINWGLSAQEWMGSYHQQKKVLSQIIDVCNNNGVRVLLLKGIGLSKLYPKPESRVCGDIDIYLFGDYEKGNDLFSNGVFIFGDGDKHANFTYNGVTIENHLTIINTNTRQQRKVERYIESTLDCSELTPEGYYVLPPLTNLIFLIMHTLSHMESHISVTVRNLMDIAFVLDKNRKRIKVEDCFDVVKRLKISKSFELLISMAEVISGLSFEEYHINSIPERDVLSAFNMIAEKNSSIDVSYDLPIFTQIKMRWSYYRKMHWKYRYIPFSRYSSFKRVYIPPISHAVKLLLRK